MAKLERSYNVPLRREFIKVPAYKKSKRAINGLRAFMVKHMKCTNIKILKELNDRIWKHGMRNPPHHIKVNAVKEDDKVYVNLDGVELVIPTKKVEKGKEEKGKETPAESAKKATVKTKKATVKTSKKATVKKEEAKPEAKKEVKEEVKEAPKTEVKETKEPATPEKQNQN